MGVVDTVQAFGGKGVREKGSPVQRLGNMTWGEESARQLPSTTLLLLIVLILLAGVRLQPSPKWTKTHWA